jgi:hypothetical protein
MVWTNEKLKILAEATSADLGAARMYQWWNTLGGPCVMPRMTKM